MRMRPGWYILLYHDISWEENWFLSSIGGTCPPDIFRDHVRTVADLGDLVSIDEGMRRVCDGEPQRPCFSFWFDDGLSGVPKNALPILEEFGTTAAVSICSAFLKREEFFWRFKLSYLAAIDGLRFLRSRMRKLGFDKIGDVRGITISQFTEELVAEIDVLFQRFSTESFRKDAFRMFFGRRELETLANKGWEVTNHSARHYPVGVAAGLPLFRREFEECEDELKRITGKPTDYWVLPFDYETSPEIVDATHTGWEGRKLVLVGNKANMNWGTKNLLYRYSVPIGTSDTLLRFLKGNQKR